MNRKLDGVRYMIPRTTPFACPGARMGEEIVRGLEDAFAFPFAGKTLERLASEIYDHLERTGRQYVMDLGTGGMPMDICDLRDYLDEVAHLQGREAMLEKLPEVLAPFREDAKDIFRNLLAEASSFDEDIAVENLADGYGMIQGGEALVIDGKIHVAWNFNPSYTIRIGVDKSIPMGTELLPGITVAQALCAKGDMNQLFRLALENVGDREGFCVAAKKEMDAWPNLGRAMAEIVAQGREGASQASPYVIDDEGVSKKRLSRILECAYAAWHDIAESGIGDMALFSETATASA